MTLKIHTAALRQMRETLENAIKQGDDSSASRAALASIDAQIAEAQKPVQHHEKWLCLICLSTSEDRHQRLTDGTTCPNAILKGEPAPAATVQKPIAYLWRHTETGQTRVVMADQVFTAGPQWALVGPLGLLK